MLQKPMHSCGHCPPSPPPPPTPPSSTLVANEPLECCRTRSTKKRTSERGSCRRRPGRSLHAGRATARRKHPAPKRNARRSLAQLHQKMMTMMAAENECAANRVWLRVVFQRTDAAMDPRLMKMEMRTNSPLAACSIRHVKKQTLLQHTLTYWSVGLLCLFHGCLASG